MLLFLLYSFSLQDLYPKMNMPYNVFSQWFKYDFIYWNEYKQKVGLVEEFYFSLLVFDGNDKYVVIQHFKIIKSFSFLLSFLIYLLSSLYTTYNLRDIETNTPGQSTRASLPESGVGRSQNLRRRQHTLNLKVWIKIPNSTGNQTRTPGWKAYAKYKAHYRIGLPYYRFYRWPPVLRLFPQLLFNFYNFCYTTRFIVGPIGSIFYMSIISVYFDPWQSYNWEMVPIHEQ